MMTEEERREQADEERRENVRIHRSPSPDDKLKDATTLYVGNLSFYTTEEQIHELFSKYVCPFPPCHLTITRLCV